MSAPVSDPTVSRRGAQYVPSAQSLSWQQRSTHRPAEHFALRQSLPFEQTSPPSLLPDLSKIASGEQTFEANPPPTSTASQKRPGSPQSREPQQCFVQ